jgi:NADH-quinone oxidoreductase subunit G
MVVHTHSPKVLDVRKTVLEFLLVNHPVDCPVCDQAGECKLQDYYMEHGQYNSRLIDVKVQKEKKAIQIGPNVMLDQERCILCTRCVRFTDHVTKTSELGVFERGDHSQLDVYPGKQVDNNYAGNVVDICPVGALTDKDFRFKCRVWYLAKTKSVCPGCSMGCNITVEWDKMRPHTQKKARVMRLKPRVNAAVNDHWMCDVGRYNYRFIDENRILYPQYQNDLIQWDVAIDLVAKALKAYKADRIGVLASAQLTNEDLYAVKKLFKDNLKGAHIGLPQRLKEGDDFLLKADRNPNTAGAVSILDPQSEAGAIIQKAKNGELDVLYVFGHDLIEIYGKEAVEQIAKNVKIFIYQGSNINPTCSYANVILPSTVYAEKDGTFTNVQQRVQRIWAAFMPMAESKGDWQILTLVGAKLGAALNFQSSQQVFDDIVKVIPAFGDMNYEKLSDNGMILKK